MLAQRQMVSDWQVADVFNTFPSLAENKHALQKKKKMVEISLTSSLNFH